jgi:hypothetical protein
MNDDNKHQIELQERIKTDNKSYFMIQKVLELKIYPENYNQY